MKERNIYNRLLIYYKRQTILKKIIKSENDTKQLFHLIKNITMNKTANPMPKGKMDEQLVEEFSTFFHDKIEKNQSKFQDIDE